jgi:hypothetical protein
MPDSSSRYCAGGINPPQDPQCLEREPVCLWQWGHSMDLSKKRPTQRCLKDTAGLADYSVTEGQQLDVPLVHPELRSRAGTFAGNRTALN